MLKHVGRIRKTQKKCCVVYRVVPGDAEHCVLVLTESLMAEEHDALMKLVESPTAQESYELGEAMSRATLPDGRNMLVGFHTTGRMMKVATSEVEMLPDSKTTIGLDELNQTIAQHRGVTVEELALNDPNTKKSPDTPT